MDTELRLQVLRALTRDRQFLRSSWRDVDPEDFAEREERIIAKAAVGFWEKYEAPIGAMLRSEVEEVISRNGMAAGTKKKLKDLVDAIQTQKIEPVSLKALEDRVKALKRNTFYEKTLDDIITAHEKNEFTVDMLRDIIEKAAIELNTGRIVPRDYFAELENRITRRDHWDELKKYPVLMIDPLDEKVRAIGRGHIGLLLAPYSSGKGLALAYITTAYAMQGLKVLFITLEDPLDQVEDRLDASLTGLPVSRLQQLPNRLRKRFRRIKKQMRGRIKLVDGTEGGWTITQVEKLWEQERQAGFTADVIVIDYDDEIECEKSFKGESARRHEFAEIYRRMRRMAAKLDIILWTAAQASRPAEGKRIVTGKDTAEDISKVRKVTFAIGIGGDNQTENMKTLYVIRHRLDRSRFAVDIMTNFRSALFYDREATLLRKRATRRRV